MIKYPHAKKAPVVDTYFDTQVIDNYSWLEDANDPDLPKFITEQNALTDSLMNGLPEYDYFLEGIKNSVNYQRVSSPERVGDYIYYFYNSGLDNQPSLRRTLTTFDESELVFDLLSYNPTGKTSLGDTIFDEENHFLALSLNDNGSDVGYVRFLDLDTLKMTEDIIENVKFSEFCWLDQGLFYSSYPDAMSQEASIQTININHSVYYHKLGTNQKDDILIYQDTSKAKQSNCVRLSQDKQVLILTKSESTSTNYVDIAFVGDAKDLSKLKFIPIFDVVDSSFDYLAKVEDSLYFSTNHKALNNQVIKFNLNNPADLEVNQYETVVPESSFPIDQAVIIEGKIIISRFVDIASSIEVYDIKGAFEKNLEIPKYSQVGLYKSRKSLFIVVTSFLQADLYYEVDFKDLSLKKFFEPKTNTNIDRLIVEQIWYESKDGTKIPMYIIRDKDLILDGTNPTYLYGYGGFNVSLLPSFVPSRMSWLAKGGIIAIPNIRGGGEYGENWHQAGTKLNKQNVFDDFISAAEYLVDHQYTSSSHLVIAGGSNGGLLTAACGLQRPDLFRLCVVDVGVLDMLRYHQFTIGWAWAADYGTSQDSKEMFEYLYKYSPVHNCKAANYPRFLISTADHDDRVVPLHSYKLAANLQAAQRGIEPILLQVHTKSGHGAGKNLDSVILDAARNWSYIWESCQVD